MQLNGLNKSQDLVNEMNELEDISILFVKAIKSLEYYEKEFLRFTLTEKERVFLLKENLELKKKLGELKVVQKLMQNAGVYGYSDLIKDEIKESKI